jgi:hypothetical protein
VVSVRPAGPGATEPMTEPIRTTPAPEAVGDIVAGEPPVPITVWYVPAASAGETMPDPLAERLVANYTHQRKLIIDLTVGEQLARAVTTARRRHVRHRPADLASGKGRAALIVSGWPVGQAGADDLLADCAARLVVGGSVAVVVRTGDFTVNQLLIAAARAAGLTYLQHIVAAHDLSGRRGQLGDGGTHLRVHTDVLIFHRSAQRGDAGA